MQRKSYFKVPRGLNAAIVTAIAQEKNEPGWMIDFRLSALQIFEEKPMPTWGPDLSGLDLNDIRYYLKPIEQQQQSWDEVPTNIKDTFVALGIPQAEQKYLAGVGAQYESEVVYKSLRASWAKKGVIFADMSSALRDYPELFKRYFATVVPAADNKFAALNAAVWSGGSFVYVPKGIQMDMPLQAYFRINEPRMGQFERTLIIAEPESFVHYVEGCSAPVYRRHSLHSAVVELIALERSRIRYTTIQNWSHNVYNLVTKRAIAKRNACVEWIDGNFGSGVTMKYPAIILQQEGARGQVISIAVAGKGQQLDAGAKIIHAAPRTSSHIISKSLSKEGGCATYRGLLKIIKGATRSRAKVQCEALMLDEYARSDTYPTIDVQEPTACVEHEASVTKLNEDQLFYLKARGLADGPARALLVNGFIDAFVQELPMEYAVEINRLIAHEMEGSIG